MRFIYTISLLLLISCKKDHSFIISGNLPDSKYNGEYIYKIPMEHYSKERVDSTLITNSSFEFKGSADSIEIFILRAQKSLSRFDLQDILIVSEPGNINVKLEERSSANGTALNDSLQKWKEGKEKFDDSFYQLADEISKADSLEKNIIQIKIDSLEQKNINFHYNFVKDNQNNAVGKLIYKLMSHLFSNDKKEKLQLK